MKYFINTIILQQKKYINIDNKFMFFMTIFIYYLKCKEYVLTANFAELTFYFP